MAQIQKYLEQGGLYDSPPQPQPRLLYDFNTIATEFPREPMAHDLFSPFRQQSRLSQTQCQLPSTSMPGDIMSAHTAPWTKQPAPSDCVRWTGLPDSPLMHVSSANGDLVYSHGALQHAVGKATGSNGLSLWYPSGMVNMMPDPSAEQLRSPVSPFSDAQDLYSPGRDQGPVTPDSNSTTHMMSTSGATTSISPDYLPLTPRSDMGQQQSFGTAHVGFSVPRLRVAPYLAVDAPNTNEQTGALSMLSSDYPYGQSQSDSRGASVWSSPGYMAPQGMVAQGFHDRQVVYDTRPSSMMVTFNRRSGQQSELWSNKTAIPAQSHFQTRFMAPLTDKERAQRSKDDEMLLQMKRDGRTYRDIRKALGRKVAESTLRGRYRSLTKPRKERVRAPKWTETDIALLKRYVQDELKKLEMTHPHLDKKHKPDKISWMKIVDLIATTGGTYRFGAATAKKKWVEVTREAPLRSARRRSKV
ncbi:hypothetical protein E8E13_005380 [Curvularia kusanoi]|uniref:Myb-like domain-containing protein n=1 Tax=Curvularia kusanoi TaxID=90978 RepID=A0A9P4W887_CURKU|nr:hypothetical protein E8E13_005380 [Curvularia kusanoi]